MKTMGYSVEYLSHPSLRSIKDVNSGELDGDLPRTKAILGSYKNIIFVNVPINNQKFYVYSKYENIYLKYKNLENKNIGITFGSTISKQVIGKNVKKSNISELKDITSLKDMLISDRVDLLFLPESLGKALMETFPKEKIRKSDKPFESIDFYLVLNKKHKNLKEKIETELKKQLKN